MQIFKFYIINIPKYYFIKLIFTLLCLLLLFSGFNIYAENKNPSSGRYNLSPHVDIYIDKEEKLNIDDIIRISQNKKFKKNTGDIITFKKNVHVWIKLRLNSIDMIKKQIRNNKQIPHNLVFDTRLFHKLIFYFPEKSGDFRKRIINYSDKGDFQFRYMNVSLTDSMDLNHDIYILVKTENFSSQLLLYTIEKFSDFVFMDTMIMGAFYGALFALFLYNLVLFFILKLKVYFYYTMYLISVIIYFLSAKSHIYVFKIIPQNLSSQIYYGFACLSLLCLILFVREFLDTRESSRIIDRIIVFDISLMTGMVLLSLMGFYKFSIIIIRFHFFFFGALAIIVGFHLIRKGVQNARYFILAWAFLIIGNYISILAGTGIIEKNYFTRNAGFIGVILESLLLSLALADKFENWRKEREKFKDRSEYYLQLSVSDGLTGLYNKRYFSSKLESECLHSTGMGLDLSLIFIDIDHFKKLNDTYGHPSGDKMLKLLSSLMIKNLRDHDIICRYGGEEFVIILPDTNLEIAMILAKRLRKAVEKKPLQTGRGKHIYSTISAGVAQLKSGEGHIDFLKRADKALYNAKNKGRNYVFS